MASPVKMVLLAGGYGQRLVDEVLQAGNERDGCFLSKALLGTAPNQRLPSSLATVAGKPVLAHWVAHLLPALGRAKPFCNNVYVVCNEVDKQVVVKIACHAPGGEKLSPENVISNGTTNPSQWAGDVHDLQAALLHISLPSSHIIAISLDLLFNPTYNLNRLVEHSLLSGADVVAGYTTVTERDLHLHSFPTPTTQLQLASASDPVPIIASISVTDTPPELGSTFQEPFVLLRGTVLPLVQASHAHSLPDLISELAEHPDGHKLRAIDLREGYHHVCGLAGATYADRYLFFASKLPEEGDKLFRFAKHELTLGNDETALGATTLKAPASMKLDSNVHYRSSKREEFDRTFFDTMGTKVGGVGAGSGGQSARPGVSVQYRTEYMRLTGGMQTAVLTGINR